MPTIAQIPTTLDAFTVEVLVAVAIAKPVNLWMTASAAAQIDCAIITVTSIETTAHVVEQFRLADSITKHEVDYAIWFGACRTDPSIKQCLL